MPKRKSAIRKRGKQKTTLQKLKHKQTISQNVQVNVNLTDRKRRVTTRKKKESPMSLSSMPILPPPIFAGPKPPIVSGNISDETRRAIMLEGVKQSDKERGLLLEMERKASMIEEEARKATEKATELPEQKTKEFKKKVVIPNPFKKPRAPYGSLKKARLEAEEKKKLAMAEALKDREEEFRIQTIQQNTPKGEAFKYRGATYYPPTESSVPSASLVATSVTSPLLYTPPRTPPRVARSDTTTIFY